MELGSATRSTFYTGFYSDPEPYRKLLNNVSPPAGVDSHESGITRNRYSFPNLEGKAAKMKKQQPLHRERCVNIEPEEKLISKNSAAVTDLVSKAHYNQHMKEKFDPVAISLELKKKRHNDEIKEKEDEEHWKEWHNREEEEEKRPAAAVEKKEPSRSHFDENPEPVSSGHPPKAKKARGL